MITPEATTLFSEICHTSKSQLYARQKVEVFILNLK